jgi:hypothetical protein
MRGEALAQGRKQTHSDAVGVWEGTTLAVCPGSPANRCNAQQKVTMTLVEGENSQLGGSYKCAYGNMNCYNMNETGKVVDGMLTGRLLRLRVLMPDGTSCMFNGRLADGSIDGGYSCYTGGSLLERGSWRAKRILEGRISQHRRHAAAIAMKIVHGANEAEEDIVTTPTRKPDAWRICPRWSKTAHLRALSGVRYAPATAQIC